MGTLVLRNPEVRRFEGVLVFLRGLLTLGFEGLELSGFQGFRVGGVDLFLEFLMFDVVLLSVWVTYTKNTCLRFG